MKTFIVILALALVILFRKKIVSLVENRFMNNDFPNTYHDECFMCNRDSCIEPYYCEYIEEGVTDEKTLE